MPGFALWIGKGKVGKKGIVSKVPEPRSIIHHGIDWSWDVVGLVEVAMMTLVKGLEAKEIGCQAHGSRGAFALPTVGGNVVR